MKRTVQIAGVLGALGLLAACAEPTGFEINTLNKGTQVGVRALVANHAGQRGCVNYDPTSNSCAALTRSRIVGNTIIGEEITALRSPTTGKPVRIVVATRGRVVGKDACVKSSGIKVGAGNEDKDLAEFAVAFTKELVKEAGEVCGSYFEAGEGYVLSSRAANGQPFPPGDTAFVILDGDANLRLQE